MMKHGLRWTLAAFAVAVSVSAGWACDGHAQDADAKDGKTAAAQGDAKGCDMPCCAHAHDAANAKTAEGTADDKPCAGHDPKGCPKKAAAVAKPDAVKDTPKAEPSANSGTQR